MTEVIVSSSSIGSSFCFWPKDKALPNNWSAVPSIRIQGRPICNISWTSQLEIDTNYRVITCKVSKVTCEQHRSIYSRCTKTYLRKKEGKGVEHQKEKVAIQKLVLVSFAWQDNMSAASAYFGRSTTITLSRTKKSNKKERKERVAHIHHSIREKNHKWQCSKSLTEIINRQKSFITQIEYFRMTIGTSCIDAPYWSKYNKNTVL